MPYNPLKLTKEIERKTCKKQENTTLRRYTRFRSTRHYNGNVAGDVSGCNLRCAYCWAWKTSFNPQTGTLYTPQEAAKRIMKAGPYKLARLTGGEPLLCWPHTRELIRILVNMHRYKFILETNGLLIGSNHIDPREIPQGTHIRISIKAPTPELFQAYTGAHEWALNLQLKALENLLALGLQPGIDFHPAIVAGLAPPEEYKWLLKKLYHISPRLIEEIEWEYLILYPHVKRLLSRRGLKPYLAWDPLENKWINPRNKHT